MRAEATLHARPRPSNGRAPRLDHDEIARRQLAQVGLAVDLAAPSLALLDDAVDHSLDVAAIRRAVAGILARLNGRQRAARRAR